MNNQPVKSEFNQPGSGQVWQSFWNGKTYGNGNQYISARPQSGSEVRITVNNRRIVEVSGQRSREFGEAAAKSVGLM